MDHPLQEQVALVLGASSGMGRAIAATLAGLGMTVYAAARRRDRLESLAAESKAAGQTVVPLVVDVARETDIEAAVSRIQNEQGRLDILVYATGTNTPERSWERVTEPVWDSLLTTNLKGAFLATKAVLPLMRAQQGGLIIYLSSAAVQMPDVSGVAYQASKHGMVGLAHGTRVEEKANGIRTSVVFPGLCHTEILSQRPVPTPESTLQLALDPQDVADAVAFLAKLPTRAVVPELQLFPSRI